MENKDFEIEQESLDMNNLALSNVTKYLATYKNPKEWILDEKEAKAARVLKSVAPEKSSKVGSLAYSAGEVLRTTAALPRQFLGSVDLLSSALKDRFYPNAEESALQRWANNYGKLEAQREETSQELISQEVGDIDWYTWGAAGGQLIRDIALTGGIAKLGAKAATKAAEKRLAGTLAGEEVAQRYTRLMAGEGAKKAGSAAITGSVFTQEVGSRTVDDINQYIARTGDADLKYYDPSVDLAVNIGVGALSAQIEKGLGVERFVPRLIARGAGEKIPGLTQILARGAEGMVGESLEEGAQETAGQIGEMIKGYRDWWDFDTDQILTSMTIGGVLGGTAGAGLYYINRRTAINRLVNEGMDKNLAADLVDTIASNEINKTINNLSAATELNTKNGEAYDKLKAGIKRALELQGWSEKMIDPKTGAELSIDEYVDLTVNSQIINTAVREAFNSGITIDEFLDVAQFTAVDNFMVLRPLGTTEEINARIDEQKAIIARQQDLKKTGAGDNTILREAKMKKAILEKVRLNKIVNDEIQKVNLEEAKTPENVKEIETADKDVEALKTAPTASDFNASLDNTLTTAQKTKRLGNAVLKKIFGSDKLGFDSVITLPEYTNAKTALTNSAERIINFAKKHRTYGIQTDLRNALNLMRTVNQGNFLEHATTPSLDGTDVIAQNAFLYHFLFKDADTTTAFIDAYLERAEASISGETDTKLTKKDLVGQALKATDNLMQVQAESAGIEYNSIYNEDGSYKDQNVAAVMMSYQNQFVQEQRKIPTAEEQKVAWKKAEEITKRVLENVSAQEKALSKKTGAVEIKGKNGTIYSPVKSEGDIFIQLTPQINDITKTWMLKFNKYSRITQPNSILGGYGGEFISDFGNYINLDTKSEVEEAINQIVGIYGKDNVFFGEEFVDPAFSDYQKEYKRPKELDWKNKEIRDIVNELWGRSPQMLEQFDLADENARLDDIYPEYTGETIEVEGKERSVYNSNGERIAQSEPALRNFYKWFGDSKVVDSQGRPIVMYHGTSNTFDSFDPTTFGYATDSGFFGSGFYFTPIESEARYYGRIVMPVYLKIEKPFIVSTGGYYSGLYDNLFEGGGQLLKDLGLLAENDLKNFNKYERLKKEFLKNAKVEKIYTYDAKHNEVQVWRASFEKNGRSYESNSYRPWEEVGYNEQADTKENALNNAWGEYAHFNDLNFLIQDLSFTDYIRTNGLAEELSNIIKSRGYDGTIAGDEHIVFEPNQIKSVDNRGTFSEKTGNILYQPAYAGSRVDYNRPSLEAIGSGEGNQSHGWGLYYALDPVVADLYRRTFTEGYRYRTDYNGKEIEADYATSDKAVENVLWDMHVEIDNISGLDETEKARKAKEKLEKSLTESIAYEEKRLKTEKNEQLVKIIGNMLKENKTKLEALKTINPDLIKEHKWGQVHEVDIPEMDVLLDEQTSFSNQPTYVKKALERMLYDDVFKEYHQTDAEDFAEVEITDWELGFNGGNIYDRISNLIGGDKQASQLLEKYGIKGITYDGNQDGRCFVIFNPDDVKVLRKKFDNIGNVLFQGRQANGFFDPELNVILLGKNWNTMTLPHELAHYWLNTLFNVYKRVQSGELKANAEWVQEKKDMFTMLGIDENQDALTTGQQEKFARMTEAYLTGIGVSKEMNQTFKDFFNWVPEKYKSILQLGYLDDQGKLQYPFLDQKAVDFFNRWYENASLPSLPTSPERQRFMNVTDGDGEVEKVSIKEMNDREKEFAQDAEEQQRTDARLYNTLDENMPADIKPVADAQKVVIDERSNFLKESQAQQVQVVEEPKRRWFERKSRETETQKAQEYIEKNPEHAKEVIFGDPELIPNDTGVDRATLINTYMALNNITPENPDWATLHTNIAINQSLAGTQLALSNDKSYGAYLDALREVENALELKAATNYAGSKNGARERFNADIQKFLDKELPAIFATQPNSKEREVALRAMFEKARTTFSGNTTGSFLNQVDLDYAKGQTKKTEAFMRWAINQIKKDAGAKLNNEQQAKLLQISAKAQQAMEDLDNRDAGKAVAAAQELRNWQMEKQALMGVSPQKFSLFGDYAPRAMLASFNTLVVANIPSTAINTVVVNATKTGLFGKNEVSKDLIDSEVKRIKAIYGATGMNLAQMEKPTSPSLLHGEKYSATGQKWYDPYTILGKEDNFFRVPTFVNTLAQIASTDAKATGRSADDVFREYASINNQTDEAKLARKQALAVANMAVFTQNGALASCLNHIRSELNKLSRVTLGLDPQGFGLGNLIAPFLTTGANIAEMGIRGSLAPITTITTMVNKWRTGKTLDPMKALALRMDWTYFTLSAVSMVLLAALTSDDDDFYTDPYRTGIKYSPDKPYDSINLAGVWLDLDFFGPFSIPMRTAAKVIQAWKKDNGIGNAVMKGYAESAKSVLGDVPLAESIINNQVNWAVRKPGSWASSYLYTQANKLVPAQIKPISRAVSRGEEWIFEPFAGTTVGRKFNRNYGFDGAELTTQDLIELFTIKVQLDESLNQNL